MASRTLALTADKASIGTAAEWAESQATELGVLCEASVVRLCIEEAFTNIVHYAFDDDPARHKVKLTANLFGRDAAFTIEDDGRPFDPVSIKIPGDVVDLHDAEVGGRGIRLMRYMTSAMSYQRKRNKNVLTLRFERQPE